MSVMTPTRTEWGFIEPDPTLAEVTDLAAHMNVPVYTGHRAHYDSLRGRNQILDSIIERLKDTKSLKCEDQCTARYYVDLFEVVRAHFGRINRVVEVGVFMGGASTMLAGCANPMNFELDLVDLNKRFLLFTHERIRRTFPEAIGRVRLFHGDLPTYVHQVLQADEKCTALVQHDGAHDFTQVVKDLSALSFVKDRVLGLTIQDTHLRGDINHMNFVDAAIYAVFGFNATIQPMGATYFAGHPDLDPNRFQGNYFLPDTAEGAYLSFAANTFLYPHPSAKLETMLPKRAA